MTFGTTVITIGIITCDAKGCDARFETRSIDFREVYKEATSAGWKCFMFKGRDICPQCISDEVERAR